MVCFRRKLRKQEGTDSGRDDRGVMGSVYYRLVYDSDMEKQDGERREVQGGVRGGQVRR